MTITPNTNGTYTAFERADDGRRLLAESDTRQGAMIEMYKMALDYRVKKERMG